MNKVRLCQMCSLALKIFKEKQQQNSAVAFVYLIKWRQKTWKTNKHSRRLLIQTPLLFTLSMAAQVLQFVDSILRADCSHCLFISTNCRFKNEQVEPTATLQRAHACFQGVRNWLASSPTWIKGACFVLFPLVALHSLDATASREIV